MRLILEINCENSAFDADRNNELSRILRDAAERLSNGKEYGALRDLNGNCVGDYEIQTKHKRR